jgi:hypothetical protein
VAIAVLTLVGACLVGGQRGTGTARAPETPVYVRINVSEKTSVYLEFQGREVRAAMSAEGLTAATPSKPRQEIALPIPADQLPAGITAVKSGLAASQAVTGSWGTTPAQVWGYLAVCRTDDRKAEWQCILRVASPAADSADKAPAIQLPDLTKLTLSVAGNPAAGSLGVGIRLLADKTELFDVRKDGKSVDAQITVADASGKQAGSTKEPLAGLGFG